MVIGYSEENAIEIFIHWDDILSTTGCLDPENFKDFKLVERRQLSHNVAKFRFALPTPTSVLGLPIGQHISCRLVHLGCMLAIHTHITIYILNFIERFSHCA